MYFNKIVFSHHCIDEFDKMDYGRYDVDEIQ
jgi:hypothetical protein